MPADDLGRDPRGQPVGGVPHHAPRRCPAMAARGYGRVVNIASRARPRRLGRQGALRRRQARAGRAVEGGGARIRHRGRARRTGGVTVNCIAPGWTETVLIEPQIDAARRGRRRRPRRRRSPTLLAAKQPSQRTSDPSEIGALALLALRARSPTTSPAPRSRSTAAGRRNSAWSGRPPHKSVSP